MAGRKVLIPYNFTPADEKALDFVITNFADRENVKITLFHAYNPAPEIDMKSSPVMDRMAGNLTYLRRKVSENEEALKSAKKKLIKTGFPENRVEHLFQPKAKDIGSDIASTALKGGFDIVVINRKPGGITKFFTGSVFEKVVSGLKDVTVCVVT